MIRFTKKVNNEHKNVIEITNKEYILIEKCLLAVKNTVEKDSREIYCNYENFNLLLSNSESKMLTSILNNL